MTLAIVGATASTSTFEVSGIANDSAAAVFEASTIVPLLRSMSALVRSMPLVSRSLASTVYRNFSVVVPLPETYVAFLAVPLESRRNWILGVPVTVTVLVNVAVNSSTSPAL